MTTFQLRDSPLSSLSYVPSPNHDPDIKQLPAFELRVSKIDTLTHEKVILGHATVQKRMALESLSRARLFRTFTRSQKNIFVSKHVNF